MVSRSQRAGQLNPDLDPRLLVVSLVGLTLFPAAGAPIWRQMFDANDLEVLADCLAVQVGENGPRADQVPRWLK